jgi:hypothetical protein
VEATRLPDKKKKEQKQKDPSYNYYCEMKLLQEKSGSAHEIQGRNLSRGAEVGSRD